MDRFPTSFLLATFLLSGCVAVVVDKPASPEASIPGSPGPSYIWIGHSWDWDNSARVYVYREGYWEVPKKKSAVWVDGYWKQTRSGWKYVRGHWKYSP